MVVSEAAPFAKTGGLADVASALAKALARAGHYVTVVMPKYRDVGDVGPVVAREHLRFGDRSIEIGVVDQVVEPRLRMVFVECDELYDRDGLYGQRTGDHPDNALRFAVLARAALEDVVVRGLPCDLIHAHDWQAGLVPVYLRTRYAGDPVLGSAPVMFTVHNIAYQGLFSPAVLDSLDIESTYFTSEGIEFWGQASFLKAGLVFADCLTTVSRGHARELLTPEYGCGLDGVVRARQDQLLGVRNGIDEEVWNPAADPWIPAPFSADDLSGKQAAKRLLLEQFRLMGPDPDADLRRPVIGLVSRLVYQKGFEIIAEIMDELAALDARIVLLGTGESRFENLWRHAARDHPAVFGVEIGYDEPLAHLITAGADLFLMPSRYEPCGLNQMYSMRYGTVPVVRATGGLNDTVTAHDDPAGGGNGFKFAPFDAPALLTALKQALAVYRDPPRWRALQQHGMTADFSWTASAAEYLAAYREMLGERQDIGEGVADA